jgi:hypothetical protein
MRPILLVRRCRRGVELESKAALAFALRNGWERETGELSSCTRPRVYVAAWVPSSMTGTTGEARLHPPPIASSARGRRVQGKGPTIA